MKDEELVDMDENVASATHLNLGDEIIHNILKENTAKEIWDKLEGLHTRKNLTKSYK